jgi:hypothetical protein
MISVGDNHDTSTVQPDLIPMIVLTARFIQSVVSQRPLLNLDQVPRYFEQEGKSNLCVKGQKRVTLAQGLGNRKRFTYTMVISAEGNIAYLIFQA